MGEDGTLYGPLHSQKGVDGYLATIKEAVAAGGQIEFGGKTIEREGNYVEPTVISGLKHDSPVVLRETFAPIVYLLKTKSLDEAIEWNNEVEQGLSSSYLQKIWAKCSSGSVPWVPTAVSSMSTFQHLELKLVALLEVKKPLVEAVSLALMLGSNTCAGQRAPSTTPRSCLWLRVSSLNSLQFYADPPR